MPSRCPSGYILRKGYTRKYRQSVKNIGYTVRRKGKVFTVHPTSKTMRVSATCIKNRGLPGKGPPGGGSGIGKLRKGELIKYGYQYRLPFSMRKRALKTAIKKYGLLSVYRKLDAVAKLSKRTAPNASHVFEKNRDWVHKQLTRKRRR